MAGARSEDKITNMDLEAGSLRSPEEKEDPIKHEDDDDDDTSSTFSWEHMEGPPSLRRATSSKSSLPRQDSSLSRSRSLGQSLSRTITRRPTTFNHPLTHEKTSPNVLVDFDGPDDPYRPLNWPAKKKIIHTVIYGLCAMCTSFASAVYSEAIAYVDTDFGVGQEVGTLGIALLLFGLGLGPLLWGPLSEVSQA